MNFVSYAGCFFVSLSVSLVNPSRRKISNANFTCLGSRENGQKEGEEEEEEEENDAGKFLIRVSHLRPALCRYCKPSLGNDTRRYFIHKIRARTAYTPGFYYYLIADSFPIHAERDEYSFLRLCGFPFFFS